MTVHIIQPAIPTYRNALYTELAVSLMRRLSELKVYACAQDHLGVNSKPEGNYNFRIAGRMVRLFGGALLWQTGLKIDLKPNDILVLCGNPRILNLYFFWIFARIKRVPIVWWGQGWSAGRRGFSTVVRRQIMKFFDFQVLYTDAELNDYLSLGFNANKITALNNGLDVELINATAASIDAKEIRDFKHNHGLDKFNHIVLFIGRVTNKSKLHVLLEAVTYFDDDIGVAVVGDGPLASSLRNGLSEELSGRIIWAGETFLESNIAVWMLSSTVFVYPGAVGLSLIHSLSYGLPAIIHDDAVDHMPEVAAFAEGTTGLKFRKDDPKSLADCVNSIIRDPVKLAFMRNECVALTRKTFNCRDMAHRFDAILGRATEQAIRRRRSRTIFRVMFDRAVRIAFPGKWCFAISHAPPFGQLDNLVRSCIIFRADFGYYWADPFLIDFDEKLFVLFEEFDYWCNRGRIRIAELHPDGTHSSPMTVLDEPGVHFSFPFVLHHDGSIYMIPETSGERCIRLYRAKCFPEKWEYVGNLIDNIDAVDPILARGKEAWLLICSEPAPGAVDGREDISVFSADSPICIGGWKRQEELPKPNISLGARNGGALLSIGELTLRTGQFSKYSYGECLTLYRVHPDFEFSDDQIPVGESYFESSFSRNIHTINQYGNLWVFDWRATNFFTIFEVWFFRLRSLFLATCHLLHLSNSKMR